jgi:plasmid stabilization system protein ParE
VKYSYHPDARQEASAAIAYYAAIDPQLGSDFLTELEDVIQRIVDAPEAWVKHVANTRRCLLHRFPYGVVYLIRAESIQILAVIHLHRKPRYWIERLI